MASLTLSQSFDGLWPPDALAGGAITLRQVAKMTYVSEQGFTVTLRGTGLTYDADGLPSGGTVTGILIVKGGVTYADFAGIAVDFARAGMQVFGFDRENGGHKDPDPFSLIESSLRGNDLITGSAFSDDIGGGVGNDTIAAGAGNDYVGDEAGNDVMDGGDDWDTLTYESANGSSAAFQGVKLDAVTGIALDCWGYSDTFTNFERFKDSAFSDTLRGADIQEEFVVNRGNDVVNGRGGYDYVTYAEADHWGAHRGIVADLSTGIVTDAWKGTDTLTNIEGIRGTIYNDRLTGSAADESFLGGKGVDTVDGGAGTDWLEFWDVGDDNDGGHGLAVNLNKAREVVDDGYGNAESADQIENVDGSRFNDRIIGSAGANVLRGENGNDTLNGGDGADDLSGGWGNDIVKGGFGDDLIGGGGGNDTLSGQAGSDQFFFGWDLVDSGVDTITDFTVAQDDIRIGSWWGGGFTTADLVAGQFRSGAGISTANTADQRLIYNTTSGALFFDVDGAGGVAAVKFAVLSNQAALSFHDIHILF